MPRPVLLLFAATISIGLTLPAGASAGVQAPASSQKPSPEKPSPEKPAPGKMPTEKPSPEKVSPAQVKAAVDLLGSMDFQVRMEAGRTVRRAEPAVAVPALIGAVTNHADWYVRFRALVILSGFNDPRTGDMMLKILGEKNDRLRAVAYAWFEHNGDATILPRLLAAVDREESEFVRPALTRALAAKGSDPKARETMNGLVMKGQDLFRSAVIEALGEYRAAYALQPITDVAKIDGPLQDDAIVAMGRIGDKRSLGVLAELQQSASRNMQPSIAAAICLVGSNCASHTGYLFDTLKFALANPGYQELLRATTGGLAALAIAGNKDAAAVLFERGAPTRDPERAAIALALGTIALRNTPLVLQVLEKQTDLKAATELLREAFDMLEEDFEEERFYVSVRRAYWAAPPGSATRKIAETLIQRLEF
jgi:HEAT repeat protein